jgi:hypothetical protein
MACLFEPGVHAKCSSVGNEREKVDRLQGAKRRYQRGFFGERTVKEELEFKKRAG